MKAIDDLQSVVGQLETALRTMKKTENTATVQINGGGIVAVVVGIIGAMAIVVAVAAVIIVAIWRDADLRDMSQLRAKQRELEAYSTVHEKRLNKLESENVPTK